MLYNGEEGTGRANAVAGEPDKLQGRTALSSDLKDEARREALLGGGHSMREDMGLRGAHPVR